MVKLLGLFRSEKFGDSNKDSSKVLSSVEIITLGNKLAWRVKLLLLLLLVERSVGGGMEARIRLDKAMVAMLQAYENIRIVV